MCVSQNKKLSEKLNYKFNKTFIWTFFPPHFSFVDQPNLQKSAPTTTESQTSQTPSALNLRLPAVPERSSSNGNSQGGSSPSFSLAVIPTLKTPSFVEQSGTYRFRICPPAKQSGRGPNQRGIVLPGGFTLIQLSKQGNDKVAPKADITVKELPLQNDTLDGAPVLPGLEGDSLTYLGDRTDGSASQESIEEFNFESLSSESFDMDEDVIVRAKKDFFKCWKSKVAFWRLQYDVLCAFFVVFFLGRVCGCWDRGRSGECVQDVSTVLWIMDVTN